MPPNAEEWLAQVVEEPLDPDRPICDPHHHLWDHPTNRYLAEELLADTAGHNVVSTVFIECMSKYRQEGPDEMKPVGETDFVQTIADTNTGKSTAVCAGIVGMADLLLGDAVKPVLEAHLSASPNRFRGIRHATGWDASEAVRNSHTIPPQKLMADSTFREGFKCLSEYGLSFDAWLYHPQLPELTDLAKAFPDTPIILDHFGGPLGIGPYEGKHAEIFTTWRDDVRKLAACPNVVAKLGGLAMPINGFRWHKQPKPPTSIELAEATSAYYLHTIDQFGPERCMFESNFPVDRQSCSYTVLWNSFKRIASSFSDAEKDLMFHDTAARVYRLGKR
jgi:predicted TIM-barrel fold metal-dependent hydrolase